MGTYVVGVDGSSTAATTVERARNLARATGAAIHVVCAYADPRHGASVVTAPAEPERSSFLTAQTLVDGVVEGLRSAGVAATGAVDEGKPADVLLASAAAVGAELIIVGNRRMQGVSRILGSVASEVAHHAPCDVLIVKTV